MFAAIITEAARGSLADAGLIGAVVGAIVVPAVRWFNRTITSTVQVTVRAELRPVIDAVRGHQTTLESIARNELSQLLPNGGASMRDALEEIRTTLRDATKEKL